MILLPDPASQYPRCVEGERRTPPEDAGGTSAYERYLEALADPSHDRHEELLRWSGPFDPETFPIEEVNERLRKKFRPRRTASRRKSS